MIMSITAIQGASMSILSPLLFSERQAGEELSGSEDLGIIFLKKVP
jgi:hypothetical protein